MLNKKNSYNDKVFFNSGKDLEYKKKISKVITDLLNNPDHVDIGNNYIPSPAKEKNDGNKMTVDSNTLFNKLKRTSTIKLNVNISNNYYSSNGSNDGDSENIPTEPNFDKAERPNRIFKGCSDSKLCGMKEEKNIITSIVLNKEEKEKVNNNKNDGLHIPCTNCNNYVHIDDIDAHSDKCLVVKKEVYEAESISNENKAINYKLWKLEENLIKLKNQKSVDQEKDRENYYIVSILQYISDALNVGFASSKKAIDSLTRTCMNIETLIHKFKGAVAIQILLERAKYLIKAKLKICKDEMKKTTGTFSTFNANTSNDRSTRKSCANINLKYIEDLERMKAEKEKMVDKLNMEKQMIENKVKILNNSIRNSNYRHTACPRTSHSSVRHGTNKKPINLKQLVQETEQSVDDDFENNLIDDINSDVDNLSVVSCNTDLSGTNSSMDQGDISTLKLDDCLLNSQNSFYQNHSNKGDIRKLYKEFLQILLKIKFEQLHNNHMGIKIPEKILFKECMQREVPREKFYEFIVEEVSNLDKYKQYIRKTKFKEEKKVKTKSSNKCLVKPRSTHLPIMEVIHEEM